MKVCFVAGNAYPMLSGDFSNQKIGGAELQQVLIAKGLQELGYDVSFIVTDHGQKYDQIINGIKVYKTFRDSEGIPVLRFYYIKIPKIWRALRCANADVYYVRSAGFLPALLAVFCKIYKKRFIFAGAHDTDFIPSEFLISTLRDKILYKYGIKKADLILLQTNSQRELLKTNINLDGIVVRNLPPLRPKCSDREHKRYILWVSTIRKWKRPGIFVELAKKFPDRKFIMIGGPGSKRQDQVLYKKIKNECTKVVNLEFLGFQAFEETERYFDKAKVFVNTSTSEGFPNTFLQAWSRGIPLLSFVDPDGLIRGKGLGRVVNSPAELELALKDLLRKYQQYQSQIRIIYEQMFAREAILDQYDRIFRGLIG